MTIVLRRRDGLAHRLVTADWHAPATTAERALLAGATAPVLDLGCGPGRLVAAAAESGLVALGIDTSPLAVASARDRGLAVLQRSVFDPLPGEGRWGTVLLMDGNVGIGGDPRRLLARAGVLVGGHGRIVVEVGPPGSETVAVDTRVEHGEEVSNWFPWAWVAADDLAGFAAEAGLACRELRCLDGRWLGLLDPGGSGGDLRWGPG